MRSKFAKKFLMENKSSMWWCKPIAKMTFQGCRLSSQSLQIYVSLGDFISHRYQHFSATVSAVVDSCDMFYYGSI